MAAAGGRRHARHEQCESLAYTLSCWEEDGGVGQACVLKAWKSYRNPKWHIYIYNNENETENEKENIKYKIMEKYKNRKGQNIHKGKREKYTKNLEKES